MTARKPSPNPATDWVKIIQAIATGITMIMMAWFSVKQKTIGETVDQVKHQTDGTLTAAKLAVAISAETTATVTKNPEDIKTAKEARAAYDAQKARENSNP